MNKLEEFLYKLEKFLDNKAVLFFILIGWLISFVFVVMTGGFISND